MLMIRFQRIGRSNDPAFRIAVLEKTRAAKAGNIVELLGTYNPRSKALTLNEESVKGWIAKGAQPTDSIHNLLVTKGVIEGKKVNVLPKKTPQKSEATLAAEAAAAKASIEAAKAVSEPTPIAEELPTEAEVIAEAIPAEAPMAVEEVAEVASDTVAEGEAPVTETPAV
jgi:small subunit ribosomal protein S16